MVRVSRVAVVQLMAAAAILVCNRPAAAQSGTAETRVIHLLQRATHGPRSDDISKAMEIGVEEWLDRQMRPKQIGDAEFETRLNNYDAATMSPTELLAEYPPPRALQEQLGEVDSLTPERRRQLMREMGASPPGRILAELAGARLQRAVYSERQLEAVMTEFWFNHFNVFWGKGPTRWLVSDYENNAIRPHVFGKFETMLKATASHPAMLVYLDNWRSAGSESPAARFVERRGGTLGLNENYARELLELHTLGVDGGYTQHDVVEVARAFSGWTLDDGREWRRGMRREQGQRRGGLPERVAFKFRPQMHDQGQKTVLGRTLRSGQDIEDGLQVLHMLALHPSTAQHLATKLVQAFVSDSAPAGLVDEIAGVYLETEGDLSAVTKALFTAEQFYAAENIGAKVKSPFELIASALRMSAADVGPSRRLFGALRELGHVPYLEPAPTGYPDTDPEWVSSGAMLQRLNLGLALAAGQIDNVDLNLLPGSSTTIDPVTTVLDALLPGVNTGQLESVVRADLETNATSARERDMRTIGLVLGSPEFQYH